MMDSLIADCHDSRPRIRKGFSGKTCRRIVRFFKRRAPDDEHGEGWRDTCISVFIT